jgi:hypothetical protein
VGSVDAVAVDWTEVALDVAEVVESGVAEGVVEVVAGSVLEAVASAVEEVLATVPLELAVCLFANSTKENATAGSCL